MADVIENYSKFDVRAVLRFLQAEGVSQREIHRRFVNVYDQNVFSRKAVSVWCKKFKDCRTALNEDPQKHRGRQRTSHTDENCVIVEVLLREDRKVKVREITEVTDSGKRHCS
jgi:transposase